jgi:hypothetical protein
MFENIGGFRGKGRIKQVQMDAAPDDTYDVVCGGVTPNGRGVKRPSRYEQDAGSYDVVCGGQRCAQSLLPDGHCDICGVFPGSLALARVGPASAGVQSRNLRMAQRNLSR